MNTSNWNKAFPDTPESFKNKVIMTLDGLPDREESNEMRNIKVRRRGFFRKEIAIALVAAMVIGTTVFGVGKVYSIYSSSSNIPTYTSLPTAEQVKDKFEFTPKLVDKFDNGYAFADGYSVDKERRYSEGTSPVKSKQLDFTYKNGKNELDLSMQNVSANERSEKEKAVDTYKGIDVYYDTYANKSEPGDYKMTEQDEKDKASGKYVFSFGSDKEEISQVQYMEWDQNGINYSILAIDSPVSKDELVKMAHQVIDTK